MFHFFKFVVLCLTVWSTRATAIEAPPQRPGWDHTFSRNRQFSAKILWEEEKVIVYRSDKNGPEIVWSKSLKRESEGGVRVNFRLEVAEDGSAVAMRPRDYFGDDIPALRLITRGGGDRSFGKEDIKDPRTDLTSTPAFHFFAGEPATTYAIWQEYSERWLIFDLQQVAMVSPKGAVMDEVERKALAEARELARSALPGPLKRMGRRLRNTAAEYVSSLSPSMETASLENNEKAALHYLAHRKEAEDRAVIERLLEGPLTTVPHFLGFSERFVELSSDKRALGDELLSCWDGKRVMKFRESGLRQLNFLGGFGGTVKLPISIPAGSGDIWVYLIPNHLERGAWESREEVLQIRCRLERHLPGESELPLNRSGSLSTQFLQGIIASKRYGIEAHLLRGMGRTWSHLQKQETTSR